MTAAMASLIAHKDAEFGSGRGIFDPEEDHGGVGAGRAALIGGRWANPPPASSTPVPVLLSVAFSSTRRFLLPRGQFRFIGDDEARADLSTGPSRGTRGAGLPAESRRSRRGHAQSRTWEDAFVW